MKTHKHKTKSGFTLIDLSTTTMVIGLLLALSFPIYSRIRIGVNETSAEKSLTAFRDAITNFQTATNQLAPTSMTDLNGYLDEGLAPAQGPAGAKSGYSFTFEGPNQATNTLYRVIARPQSAGVTGVREFILDEAGVITANLPPATGVVPGLAPNDNVFGTFGFFSELLEDPSLTGQERAKILAGFLEFVACMLTQKYLKGVDQGEEPLEEGTVQSTYYRVS
jgi:Tfp pilus assembly protein PilE